MDPEFVASVFKELQGCSDESVRQTLLHERTGDDAALRAELESLIAAHDSAGDFLEDSVLEEAASLLPDMLGSSLIGSSIGSWRVDALIDAGGMGSVFRATRIEEDFTQTGALKLIRVGFETEELVRRFARERQLLARVEHPQIARLLDGGTTGEGLPWLAMEYVDGLPIDTYADRHRLTIAQRLDLFDQLADAVAYLHHNLITHRDIKTSNVLVDSGDCVKLLDFGIANLLEDDEVTREATAFRRLSFTSAAPEQLRSGAITAATDIYALGIILYRLLSGAPPYRIGSDMSATEIEILICDRPAPLASSTLKHSDDAYRIAEQRRASPRRLIGELAGDLDTILARALQKEPQRRYRSVEELRDDLQRYRENRPIRARPDSAVYRTVKFARRHWRPLATTSGIIFALAVGLVAALWQADEAQVQRDRAQAMNRFMQEVLAEADPYASDGERTVRDALADASVRLGQDFADQPLLEASLRQVVGGVQASMFDLDGAEANLRRALALMENRVADDDEMRLRTEAYLAWLEGSRENYDESIKGYLAIVRRLTERHPIELRASVHNDLGLVYIYAERFQEALGQLQVALSIAPGTPDRIGTLVNLGLAADGLGRIDDAKGYFLEAIERLRARGEAGVIADLAHALNNYGNLLSQQGLDEDALAYYLESLEVRFQTFGKDSESAARQHMNVGRLLLDMSRPKEALAHLERAVTLLPQYRDADSLFVSVAQTSLARATILTATDVSRREKAIGMLESQLAALTVRDGAQRSRFAIEAADWLEDARRMPLTAAAPNDN